MANGFCRKCSGSQAFNVIGRKRTATHTHPYPHSRRIIYLTTNQRIGTKCMAWDSEQYSTLYTYESLNKLIDPLCHFHITLSNVKVCQLSPYHWLIPHFAWNALHNARLEMNMCATECFVSTNDRNEIALWRKLIPYLSCVWGINARISHFVNNDDDRPRRNIYADFSSSFATNEFRLFAYH